MQRSERRSEWRRRLSSTGAPPQWGLVLNLVYGGAAGAILGVIFVPQKGAALAALTGALVAAAGSRGPSRVALRVAGLATVTAVLFVFIAFVVAGHPWWAAVAIALVAIFTSTLLGAGPVGSALAQLGLLIYGLAVILVGVASLSADVSLASAVLRIGLGAVAGLAVTAVGARLRDRRDPAAAAAAPRPSFPWPALWTSLRTFDEHARDGVRRAIPLAISVFLYARTGSHDALWVFIAAFVVLMPAGKSPLDVALVKVISTIAGVVLLGLLALVVPPAALPYVGIAAILAGVLFKWTYPVSSGALGALGAILLVGAPSGAVGTWAAHRLLDTALGCALALASLYLLWPKDRVEAAGSEDGPDCPEAQPGGTESGTAPQA